MREINGFLEAVIYNRLAWVTKVSLREVGRKRSITFFLNPSVRFACRNNVFSKFNGTVACNARWNVCQTFWIYRTCLCGEEGYLEKYKTKKLGRFFEDSCQPHPSWPIEFFSQSPTPPPPGFPSDVKWNTAAPWRCESSKLSYEWKSVSVIPRLLIDLQSPPASHKTAAFPRQSLKRRGHFLDFSFLPRFRCFLVDRLHYPTIMIYRTWRRFIF